MLCDRRQKRSEKFDGRTTQQDIFHSFRHSVEILHNNKKIFVQNCNNLLSGVQSLKDLNLVVINQQKKKKKKSAQLGANVHLSHCKKSKKLGRFKFNQKLNEILFFFQESAV